MKKIMFGLGAALALVACADIESSNVVGYTTKAADKGKFLILGAGFQQVGGSMAVNGLLSGVQGVDFDEEGTFMATAAQVQLPIPGGYDTFFYLNDGWFDDNGADGYKPGWCDGFGGLVDAEFTPGIAFWFKSVPGTATATIAGEVPAEDSIEISCPVNFALRANPFPTAVKINSDKFTSADIIGADYDENGDFMLTAPQIQIPIPGGYDTYFYLNDGWFDDNGADGYKPGWCDGFGGLVDAEIPAGQGIWTKGVSGAFTLKFSK